MTEGQHPLDAPREPTGPAPIATTEGVGVARHLASLMIAIALVPAAYLLLDRATFQATGRQIVNESVPSDVYLTMGVAAGLMFLVAASGRISAFGPLVAAILWGVLPTLWVYGDYGSYADAIADAPEAYDDLGFGLLTTGFAVYPATAGLLLGVAVAGRWRRRA